MIPGFAYTCELGYFLIKIPCERTTYMENQCTNSKIVRYAYNFFKYFLYLINIFLYFITLYIIKVFRVSVLYSVHEKL